MALSFVNFVRGLRARDSYGTVKRKTIMSANSKDKRQSISDNFREKFVHAHHDLE